MIKQVNPGALLPFYAMSTGFLRRTESLTSNADGWKILASNRRLIPFILWEDAAPKTVTAFDVVNMDTGRIWNLSTALIIRQKRSDDSRTWYFFKDADISLELPCGRYIVILNLSGTQYFSDGIQLVNMPAGEYSSISATACAGGVVTLTATDSVAGAISLVRTEYRLTGDTSWTNFPAAGSPPYTYEFDMTAIALPSGQNILIRRTILTDAGNTLQSLYALDWDFGDPCGTYRFYQIDETSSYRAEYWAIKFSDSAKWEDKVYKSSFQEIAYLPGYFDYPEVEREIETLVSNTGARVTTKAETREFMVMVFARVPDQFIYPLSAIGDYSSITLQQVAKTTSIGPIPGAETEFTVERDSGGYYSRGRLRWRNNYHYETACVTGETTVTP